MDTESAINFLVEHAAKADERLGRMEENMATRKDLSEVKVELRDGTKAMRQYTSYVESMLNVASRGQLSLEEQMEAMRAKIEAIEQRVAEIEKRNPPQAA
ncbi:MAG: hypothetical protein ABSG25_00115 [Bryobacteraceae bacterium]|jgi:wobble nucleotide-excising tRNase